MHSNAFNGKALTIFQHPEIVKTADFINVTALLNQEIIRNSFDCNHKELVRLHGMSAACVFVSKSQMAQMK